MDDKIVTIQISIKSVNIILKQLMKMKYYKAAALIADIQKQSVSQLSTPSETVK